MVRERARLTDRTGSHEPASPPPDLLCDSLPGLGCSAVLLQAYGDDDYLVFDCPGQIELYSHLTVFRSLVEFLRRDGWQVCAVSGRAGGGGCREREQVTNVCLIE